MACAAAAAATAEVSSSHQAFFASHCTKCHSEKTQEGGVRLDDLPLAIATVETAERWQKVLGVLNAGEMPPAEEPQPKPDAKLEFLADLSQALAAARKAIGDQGQVTLVRRLYHRDWDHHAAVRDHVKGTAAEVDRGAAALVEDLSRRGMLDDTLVVFGTEFGRTPMAQGKGRDHHMKAFSMWLAGGGIKPGITYGATDELGYGVVENPVTVHDLHATLLHLMGIDHLRLTIRAQGRDFRLTDVAGTVVKDLLT